MSEDQARSVLDALPMAVIAFDADQRLAYVNAQTFELARIDRSALALGTGAEEILRLLAYRGFYGPGDPEAQVRAALAIDRTRPLRRVRQSTPGRWFEVGSYPLAGGGWIGTSREVTREKAAEMELRERADRLEAALAVLSGGVALHDASGRLTLHNPAFASLMGAHAGMLSDHPDLPELMRRLHAAEEFHERAEAEALAATLSGAEPGTRKAQRRRPDGTVVRLESAPTSGGGFVVEATDVTALKRAEDEAQGRAAMLQAIVSALPHGVCVFGPEWRVSMMNDAYQRIMEGAPVVLDDYLDDVIRRLAESGEYGPGDPAAIARVQIAILRGRPRATQRLRPNGTAIDTRTARLPDGGHIAVVTDITAIYQAEDEARRRTTILETMLETMRHGIMLFGPDRRLVTANALAERMVGLDLGGLQPGLAFDDLLQQMHAHGVFGAGEDGETLYRELRDADWSEPSRHTRRGLDGRMLEVASDPTPDGGFVITHVDITALAFAEEEAQRRADLLQSILDNMRFGVVLFDRDRRLIASNALAARLSGLPASVFRVGRRIDEIMAEAVQGGHVDASHGDRVIASDRSSPHSYRRTRSDGVVLEISSDPVDDGGFVVVLSDVTRLAATEAEAANRSRQLQAMLDNIRHGVCLFDEEGRVIAANALAARMSGLLPEEMLPGTSIEALRRLQEERGEFGASDETASRVQARTERGWAIPQRYVRRRGQGGMLEVTTDAMPNGGYIRTYSDVSADYAIRTELEAARATAEAASQAKSRFLATMSHELRTPLNAIMGFSEILAAQDASPAEARQHGRAIHEAAGQLRALIDDILDVARAESRQLEVKVASVAPAAIAAEAVARMRGHVAEAGLTLDVRIADGVRMVTADGPRLCQILLNLLSNAVKFTPAGGKVSFAVFETDGTVRFAVTDTGIGMPDADVARAFEPFTQLDDGLARRYGGSGIGLHLARVLAEAQGGNLSLESQPGQGTVATLSLPVAAADPATPAMHAKGAPA